MKNTVLITPDMRVNDAIVVRPELVATFKRFGIDACCGGALPIEEAARRHQLDLEDLLEAINSENG